MHGMQSRTQAYYILQTHFFRLQLIVPRFLILHLFETIFETLLNVNGENLNRKLWCFTEMQT